jgi:RNA polymerase sigma-70 factor, ECF subfamily
MTPDRPGGDLFFGCIPWGMDEGARAAVEAAYRADWGRIVAALIRLLGDFDIAEEAAAQAFEAATTEWPANGIPDYPRGWLIQTAKNRAIDRLRRRKRFAEKVEEAGLTQAEPEVVELADPEEIPDDRLRLIFTCCHPSLALEAQVALTLRTLGGLETEEIARAFLVSPVTMAQRLVRAKNKIAAAKIPYVVPGKKDMPERLEAVLAVIYLVFTEGYSATRGAAMIKTDLCVEAIDLARWVRALLGPEEASEVTGLLALMLFHDARRDARLDAAGDLLLLEDQDRNAWNRAQIEEALALVAETEIGPYAVQAAIAGIHCQAERKEDTDWRSIVRLYDLLERLEPSPVVSLNRAAAVAMADGPEAGLAIVEAVAASGELEDYHLLHAARADLLRRIGDRPRATESYERALALVGNDSERRFLERRLREVASG